MNIFTSRFLLIIFITFSYQLSAQEFSESDVGFEAELIEIGGGLSCIDSFNQASRAKLKGRPFKAFKTGKNVRGGSLIYFGEGFADIQAKPEDFNYIDSIQSAITLAELRAKKDLAKFRSAETTKETIDRAMEAISSGVPVSDYGQRQDDLDQREEDYNNATLDQKLYMFIDRKLDEWIGEKDAIAEDRAQLEKELENVVSQSALGEVITTVAYSEIAGMKNAQIIVSNGKVCVLSVWSQRTKRWANELGNLNYQALANLRPGKGTYDSLIPDKKSKDGLKKLTASYGLQIDVDNQGEIYFISYAQAGAMDRSSNSINNARLIAENRARGQIASFQNEAVDVYENLENIQLTTTYTDGTTNNYSERNFMARTKAASTLNVAGVEQHDWWAAMHPFTQKPVVGVVMVWRPSNAMIIESNSETEDYDDLGF